VALQVVGTDRRVHGKEDAVSWARLSHCPGEGIREEV
jgi:hypothetical protein